VSTVYISAKFVPGNVEVKALQSWFQRHGYQCAYDWTAHPVERPFTGQDKTVTAAEAMITAASSSDLFVLILTDDLVEAPVELCAALATASITNGDLPGIYIVGTPEQREGSIFYHHPAVNWCNNLGELLATIEQA
jgi:hypothetical protein